MTGLFAFSTFGQADLVEHIFGNLGCHYCLDILLHVLVAYLVVHSRQVLQVDSI
jgi:uncharacterized membrane protein YkvI